MSNGLDALPPYTSTSVMKSFLARVRRSTTAATKTTAAADPVEDDTSQAGRVATRKNKFALHDDFEAQQDVSHDFQQLSTLDSAAAANCPLVTRLPLELHIMIIAELLLLSQQEDDDIAVEEDVAVDAYLACLRTCRAWRHVWLSEQIWRGLAEEWMPGFGEMLRLEEEEGGTRGGKTIGDTVREHQLDSSGDVLCGHDRGSGPDQHQDNDGRAERFRRMLLARQRRRSGMFSSALHYGMRLQDDQLFRISTAVPAHEGGVHRISTGSDSDDNDNDGLRGSGSAALQPEPASSSAPARLCKPPPPPTTHFRFMMHNSGRVAWWPQAYARPYSAVVDDLRTGQRRMYDFPGNGGEQVGYTAAMSSELLLMGRGRVLRAWHLGLDVLRTATFPVEIVRVFVEGERVVAVGRHCEVFLWRFVVGGGGGEDGKMEKEEKEEDEEKQGGWRAVDSEVLGQCFARGLVRASGLVELPPTSPPHRVGLRLCEDGVLLDFILHPVVKDVFFVVTFSSGTEHSLQVHEICGAAGGGSGDKVRRVAVYQPSAEDMSVFQDLGDHHGYLRWEKVDSHGGYCLMMINGIEGYWARHQDGISDVVGQDEIDGSEAVDEDPVSREQRHARCCGRPEAAYTVVAVCFNVYTKEFDFVVFHPPWHFAVGSWHVWNGLLYTPDGRTSRDLIIATRRCSARRRPGGCTARDSTGAPEVATTTAEQDETASQGTGCFTTVEHIKESTKSGTVVEGLNDNDGGPVFATRAPFVMSLADERLFLADPEKPGVDSARSCIAHVLDTFQTHPPTLSSLPLLSELQAEVARAQRRSASLRQQEPPSHGRQRVLGDEGILLFVEYQDYTAWGFGRDVIVSSAAADTRDGGGSKGKKAKGGEDRSRSVARMLPWGRNRA